MHSLLPLKYFEILSFPYRHGLASPLFTTDVRRGHSRSPIFYSQQRPLFVRTHPT